MYFVEVLLQLLILSLKGSENFHRFPVVLKLILQFDVFLDDHVMLDFVHIKFMNLFV